MPISHAPIAGAFGTYWLVVKKISDHSEIFQEKGLHITRRVTLRRFLKKHGAKYHKKLHHWFVTDRSSWLLDIFETETNPEFYRREADLIHAEWLKELDEQLIQSQMPDTDYSDIE